MDRRSDGGCREARRKPRAVSAGRRPFRSCADIGSQTSRALGRGIGRKLTQRRSPPIANYRRSTRPFWLAASHVSFTDRARQHGLGAGPCWGRRAAPAPKNYARTCVPAAPVVGCSTIKARYGVVRPRVHNSAAQRREKSECKANRHVDHQYEASRSAGEYGKTAFDEIADQVTIARKRPAQGEETSASCHET
jgi:hypothetical protein